MKRAPNKPDRKQQTLGVSVGTVTACADAVYPPLLRTRESTVSLTVRGELLPARRSKRQVILIVRRAYYGAPVGGRVFPDGPALNVLVNLPPSLFTDALTLALSGHLAGVEVTTEKLKRDIGGVLAVRFATGEMRSAGSAAPANGPSSSRATAPRKSARVPPRQGRHR